MQTRKTIRVIISLLISVGAISQASDMKVSGGENHTLVLTENKFVWACGANGDPYYATYYGVLGTGSTNPSLTERTLTRVYGGAMNTTYLQDINDIAAGWMHSLALDINGFVWSWGWNSNGELGVGEGVTYSSTPVQVLSGEQNLGNPNSFLQSIIAISAGRSGRQSLALDANNFVYAWGYNYYG